MKICIVYFNHEGFIIKNLCCLNRRRQNDDEEVCLWGEAILQIHLIALTYLAYHFSCFFNVWKNFDIVSFLFWLWNVQNWVCAFSTHFSEFRISIYLSIYLSIKVFKYLSISVSSYLSQSIYNNESGGIFYLLLKYRSYKSLTQEATEVIHPFWITCCCTQCTNSETFSFGISSHTE